VRDFDLFHLTAVDRMRAKIARNRRHEITTWPFFRCGSGRT
jgi:hypothetical protein